jgi:Domain of unknown function (DUF6268)
LGSIARKLIGIDNVSHLREDFSMRFSILLCLLCWHISQFSLRCAVSQTVQFTPSNPNTQFGSAIPPPNFSQPNASNLGNPFGASTPIPQPTQQPFGTPQFGTNPSGAPGFGSQSYQTPPANNSWSNWWPWNSQANPQVNNWGTATPYNNPPAVTNPWVTNPNPVPNPNAGSWFNPPPANAYGAPQGGYPGYSVPGANPLGPPPASYANQPSTLFPNGMWGPNAAGTGPWGDTVRLLQHPRLSETYIHGTDKPKDVAINDIETAVTLMVPHAPFSTQPIYVTPTFAMHLWNGPNSISADLPGAAYSAYIDNFWATDPNRPIGAELGVAVGVFSDFNTLNTHSLRVMGEGFGVFRLTPNLTLKLGAWYLNRNDLKLLPAGGLVWQPNPQMKFDLLFPNPKISRYLTTQNNADIWLYLAGEYGGGAWTIERADGSSDRIDINDIRVKLGIDWINQKNWRGFAEVGYVFDRQVVYVVNPADSFKARDNFMVSLGFSF